MLEAVKREGMLWMMASEELQQDREIILQSLASNGECVQYMMISPLWSNMTLNHDLFDDEMENREGEEHSTFNTK